MHWLSFLLLLACVHAKTCSNHDGCSGDSISDSSLTCNGGERCCKDTKFTCTGNSCTVTIKGGGHDQFRGGIIYAMGATALHLKCQASGQRKCKNAKIFCPMAGNCICDGCPSNVKMYCPTGVLCTGGGATVVNMDKYICKGTGSNMYCPDIDEEIEVCGTQDECTSLIWGVMHMSMSCKNSTGQYNRPRCPHYYQDKYDNVVYNHVNVTVTQNEDAAAPLETLCKESIPPKSKLQKSNNRAFQIKSWNVGCEKKKATLDKCKTACNNGCCGSTCASNSCSGGGCCAASKNICISACKWMWAPEVYNIIPYINVTNETRIINKTQVIYDNITLYTNKTRWINKTQVIYDNITIYTNSTRWTNKTHNITIYTNKTRWTNKTHNITIYMNKTRWTNKTHNVTLYINQTRWVNRTQNVTRIVNKTRWVNRTQNVTRYINKTRWFNKTRNITQYINKTHWTNKTRWFNKTRWTNKTRFFNKTRWVNKTINITIEKVKWVNKTVNQTQAYAPTVVPKWENTSRNQSVSKSAPDQPDSLTRFVIWGSLLVVGFMGGCFFSYAVYKFKSFLDEWFGCCDIGDFMETDTPPPSPKNHRPKPIEIVTHPRVDSLRKRSLSNSPHKRALI